MSRGVLRAVAVVAGAVAVVASAGAALGVVMGGTMTLVGVGSAAAIAAVAGAVAAAANIGVQLLTKPPPARGSVANVIIAVDPPQPYAMGEGLVGGVRRCDNGYGATFKKVPNPYLWLVDVMSGGGPVESVTPWADKAAVSSWFNTFLYTSVALGACPAVALTPHWAGAPGWDASSKLSGQAAIGWNLLFDKDGKRFASGIPQTGGYGKWVKVYDPRLDDTFPGGAGACRLGVETTYVWSESPALHAGTYAYGRYQNGKRTIGAGFAADSIDWANIASWANVCDANDWTIFGVVYEPGNRWPNLKEIAAAGGARPLVSAGRLSFVYNAPRVAVATVTEADLAADPVEVTAQGAYADRFTTVIPKWTSPAHEWQQIAGTPLTIGDFVAEEGEDRPREWPFNLVKSTDGRQPAELGLYELWNSHELQPIVLPCRHHMRHWNAGDCFELALADKGLTTDAIVVQKRFDPMTLQPVFICVGETTAKHAFILGQTSTPPPTPALGQTPQQRDELAAAAVAPARAAHQIVGFNPSGWPMTSTDTAITITAFSGTLDDGRIVNFPGATSGALASDTVFEVYRNLVTGAYLFVAEPALAERADSDLAFLGRQRTAQAGTTTYTPPPTPPGGFGGEGGYYNYSF